MQKHRTEPIKGTESVREIPYMQPAEVLYWLDRLGIGYRLHKGAFVTDGSMMLQDGKQCLPVLKASITEHADALADLVHDHQPAKCEWCKQAIKPGQHLIRVYVQEEGRRLSFHQECHLDRGEALPNLPIPDVFIDEPGYTVLIEDNGLCCYCQMAEAELPQESPNVCHRCWKIRTAKNQAEAGAAI